MLCIHKAICVHCLSGFNRPFGRKLDDWRRQTLGRRARSGELTLVWKLKTDSALFHFTAFASFLPLKDHSAGYVRVCFKKCLLIPFMSPALPCSNWEVQLSLHEGNIRKGFSKLLLKVQFSFVWVFVSPETILLIGHRVWDIKLIFYLISHHV